MARYNAVAGSTVTFFKKPIKFLDMITIHDTVDKNSYRDINKLIERVFSHCHIVVPAYGTYVDDFLNEILLCTGLGSSHKKNDGIYRSFLK